MSASERDRRLAAGLAAWGIEPGGAHLAGDASTRRYVRGRLAGASVVVMDCGDRIPEAGAAGDPFPFTRWQSFYAAVGIRVPDVLAIDRVRGLVLLEDLGDELLQSRVEAAGAEACRPLYLRAAEWGTTLAREGTARFVPDAGDSDDPLGPERLALEMDLFLVHAARVALDPATAEGPPLRRAAQALDGAREPLPSARALLHALCTDVHGTRPRPMVLCHRDYHARNLIVACCRDGLSEDLAVIDFQDTRRGPRAYDLASLAWDPYVTLPQGLIDDLVEAWRPAGAQRTEWHEEVALTAGQRLVKAAGSYAWLGHGCGRTEYLKWFGPALSRAFERLAGWPSREDLRRRLADCGIVA